jgi:hypothetical protein
MQGWLNIHKSKETITRIERLLTEWEKIFVSYPLAKEFISKELKKINTKRTNNPI